MQTSTKSEAPTPSLVEVRSLFAQGAGYKRVPVKRELYADFITPIEALRRLRAVSNHCFMLESAEANESWGRYTFLGFSPSLEFTCADGLVRIRTSVEGACEHVETHEVAHPNADIRAILDAHKSAQPAGFPPFTGGLVGYFAYDYIKYAEPTLQKALTADGRDFLDVDLMLFDSLIVFDSYKQKIVLITGVYQGNDDTVLGNDDGIVSGDGDVVSGFDALATSYRAAEEKLSTIENILRNGESYHFPPFSLDAPLQSAFGDERYRDMIETTRNHIREGDIFQAVISNPQTAAASGSLFDAYRVLRTTNPSPYMFYFTSDDVEIAGASPETLVRLQNGHLTTYPLAGTRPRGKTADEDAALEAELLADEKELSEHNMLVDLGRNDLGRISEIGSVHVTGYQQILRFSKVMHIASTVESTIAPDKDALDAVDSILPAGTLSGAPKLRACEIIGQLEGGKRGIYGGALGYLDFSGNMDLCISIRLAYKKNGVVCVQSGGGIVADSNPELENQERLNKARAVVDALVLAEGGLV